MGDLIGIFLLAKEKREKENNAIGSQKSAKLHCKVNMVGCEEENKREIMKISQLSLKNMQSNSFSPRMEFLIFFLF